MVRAEWQHLLMHPRLLGVMLVVIFIPMMYAGFFLGSVWDPYSRIDKLPVAVVNEDAGATLQNKPLQAGNTLVAILKEGGLLNWQFVDNDRAKQGIADGSYYMRITIPKDFSKHAASLAAQEPQRAILQYEVTPARNFIGAMISRQAAEKLEGEVKKALTKAYATALLRNLDTIAQGMSQAVDGAGRLQQGSLVMGQGVGQLRQGTGQYTQAVAQAHRGVERLQLGFTQLQSGSATLTQGLATLEHSLPQAAQLQQLRDGVGQFGKGMQQLNDQLNNPQVDQQLALAEARAQQLQGLLASINQTLTSLESQQGSVLIAQLEQQITQSATLTQEEKAALQATIAQLAAQLQQYNTQLQPLLQILQQYSTRAQQEIEGVITALAQAKQLQQGVSQLATAYATLQKNVLPALSGYDTVRTATGQLAQGSRQFHAGVTQATQGLAHLYAGTSQLSARGGELVSGIDRVHAGMRQLGQGSGELASKLRAAVDKLALQPTGDATAAHIASPVGVQESSIGTVKNYGHALAPYAQSLALYIGAIIFNLLYPVRKLFAKPRNGFSWWFSKASIAAAVSFLQAMAVGLLSMRILGLTPESFWHYIAMLQATSLAYIAIVMFLSIALDNIGRFIALLLLVVQLGGSEGSFPIELSSEFFQAVHPYLPMSYSVAGLREAISGGGAGASVFWHGVIVLLGVVVVFSVLLITTLALRNRCAFSHDAVTE